MKVGISGAGAFGTALAISLAQKGPVLLWGRDAAAMTALAQTRRHPTRLPDVTLPDAVEVAHQGERLAACDIVLLCLPAQALSGFLTEHREALAGAALVACCKGVDLDSLRGPTGVISDRLPNTVSAVLTGPSFAADIARGLPTALTLACADATRGKELQHAISTPNLRLYRTTDVTGAELGGALKNVIALACGAAIGHGLGDSARAALMTRGFAEMQRFATALGAEPQTLMGLSGLGDLTLTCTSDLSRNYRHGLAWGRGERPAGGVTVEGVKTALAVTKLAALRGMDMPITAAVADVVEGRHSTPDVLAALLARPLKEE